MSHMSYELDRDDSGDGQPSLTDMTAAAVDRLKQNPDGFFLMIESGRVDHGHHENKAKKALAETLEMEKAVQVREAVKGWADRQTDRKTEPDRYLDR